jgi:hypothetical protein
MGLSFGNGPGAGPNGTVTNYPNVIDQLYEQNVTRSRSFSLDLGGVDTVEGLLSSVHFVLSLLHKGEVKILIVSRFRYIWWY